LELVLDGTHRTTSKSDITFFMEKRGRPYIGIVNKG
jgi:hypothetical protein